MGEVVRVYGHHFNEFAFLDKDDLVAEALQAAKSAWPTFDPTKGKGHNFICGVASRFLNTKKRHLTRQCRHPGSEMLSADAATHVAHETQDDADLLEFAQGIYGRSKQLLEEKGVDPMHSDTPGGFQRTFSIPQMMTLLALRERLKLSCRGMEWFLIMEPELRAAIELPRVPSYRIFARVFASVTRIRPFLSKHTVAA